MKKSKVLGILDPYPGYNFRKDSSHLLLWSLWQRGHCIFYTDPSLLFLESGRPYVTTQSAQVHPGAPYFSLGQPVRSPLEDFDLILMRKDPPVDTAYLYATQMLSLVEHKVWIINRPSSLRDYNEKLSIFLFPEWIAPTLVTSDEEKILEFATQRGGTVLLKSLDSFASLGIYKMDNDEDRSRIKTMTQGGRLPIMVQEFLPIERGEKRVFSIDGEPLGGFLRLPPAGNYLTNPDRGGKTAPTQMTVREKKICDSLRPWLREKGIFFAGIDLIDERLTEINITSPGLIWEWNEVDNHHHETELIDLIEKKLG